MEDSELAKALKINPAKDVEKILKSENLQERNEKGETFGHLAIHWEADEKMLKVLLPHIDMSVRDEKAETLLDVALSNDDDVAIRVIDKHMRDLLDKNEKDKMNPLLMKGWDGWPDIPEEQRELIGQQVSPRGHFYTCRLDGESCTFL